jgi:hypothetical protein
MMGVFSRLVLLIALSVLAFSSSWMVRAETTALPAFEVADLYGQTFGSEELIQEGRWLLIYVRPGCQPCERLLELFKRDELVQPERVVVMVRSSPPKAAAMAERFPDLTDSLWYADTMSEGFTSLKLPGVPVVHGLHGGEIAWRVNGLVSKTKDLRSILMSWLEE